MKQVIYNGGTGSYYACSNPNVLVVGKVYHVMKEHNRVWQIDYVLEGIEGKFNAMWFDEAPRTYVALGNSIPEVGKAYKCTRIIRRDENLYMENHATAIVKEVECVGAGGYKVTTKDSIYLVTVEVE